MSNILKSTKLDIALVKPYFKTICFTLLLPIVFAAINRSLLTGVSFAIRCPVCGNKTRDKIREDTVLKNFPLFCPKCKSECLIDIEQFHITVIKAPDAQPQSR